MGGLLRDDSRPTLFDLDGLASPRGSGRLWVIATVQDPRAVQALLAHLTHSGALAPAAPPHPDPPHLGSPQFSPSRPFLPGPAAAPLRPLLDRTPVAVQHDAGPRAIAMPAGLPES